MDIIDLLALSIKHHASDLHLSAGLLPMLRVNGELQRLSLPSLAEEELTLLLHDIMNAKQHQEFAKNGQVDFAFAIDTGARFRVNVFQQQRGIAAAFRVIPLALPKLDDLRMPMILKQLTQLANGLVLVTGATGSGKSTTLAAMLNYINQHQAKHILTIEDPIEFIHNNHKALIHQREVQRDTQSFHHALRAALREDPDVILIGEMRDTETIRLAITAAETGHLVFATLHTASAAKAINRMIDVFGANEKALIRTMLAESLQAVISQTLVKQIEGGRIAAAEIMLCTPAIRHLIREDKIAQIYSVMQTNQQIGMQTLDQHLLTLVKHQVIEPNVAKTLAITKELFN